MFKVLSLMMLFLSINLYCQSSPPDTVDQYQEYKDGLTDMVIVLFYLTGAQVSDSNQSKGAIDINSPGVKGMIAYVDSVVKPLRPVSKQDVSKALLSSSEVIKKVIKANKRPREKEEIEAFDKITELVLKAYGNEKVVSGSVNTNREYATWEIVLIIYVVILGLLLSGLIIFLRYESIKNFRNVVAVIALSSGVIDRTAQNQNERN